MNKYDKKYYQENKERILKKNARYRDKNRDKINEYSRKHYHENKEAVSKRAKLYWIKNKDWLKIRNQKWKDKNRNKAKGNVYVLKMNDIYKIGVSVNNPIKRIGSTMAFIPYPIKLTFMFKSIDMYRDEKILHKKFNGKQFKGEWFSLNQGDLLKIKNYAKRDKCK